MIPKSDQEHYKLIGKAMLVAANIGIFGTMAAGIIGLIVVIFLIRKRRARRVRTQAFTGASSPAPAGGSHPDARFSGDYPG